MIFLHKQPGYRRVKKAWLSYISIFLIFCFGKNIDFKNWEKYRFQNDKTPRKMYWVKLQSFLPILYLQSGEFNEVTRFKCQAISRKCHPLHHILLWTWTVRSNTIENFLFVYTKAKPFGCRLRVLWLVCELVARFVAHFGSLALLASLTKSTLKGTYCLKAYTSKNCPFHRITFGLLSCRYIFD